MHSPCGRHCLKCFIHKNSLTPQKTPGLFDLCDPRVWNRFGNPGTESLGHLSRVTQHAGSRAGTQVQVVPLRVCALSPRATTRRHCRGAVGAAGTRQQRQMTGPHSQRPDNTPASWSDPSCLKTGARGLGSPRLLPFTTLPRRRQASSPHGGRASPGRSSLLLVSALPVGILWAEGR